MDAYDAAERRLGRQLSDSERRIDLIGYDRDLEQGKRRLYQAIEAEKKRVIGARLKGRRARMRVTPEMSMALMWLYRRGRAHARAELVKAGVIERRYAEKRERRMLGALLKLLQQLLLRVGTRIELEIRTSRKNRVDTRLSLAAYDALARAMEKKVPGSLSIAADLVSGAMAEGLGDEFEPLADQFEEWLYSAVMDGGTCEVCRELDGTTYPSWAAIQVVLPNGGPNPLCRGNGRCRCRVVPGKLRVE